MKNFLERFGSQLNFAILGLAIALSLPSFAGKKGGGAGNGGGIGIRCQTDHIKLIERFIFDARQYTFDSQIPLDFKSFHASIAERLKTFNSTIAREYSELATQIGALDTWEVRNDEGGSKVQTFDAHLDFNLPEECSLIQMAVFPKGESKPYLTLNWAQVLETLDARLVESHEILYHLGVLKGWIDDPVLVRSILQTIVTPEWKSKAGRWIQLYSNPSVAYANEMSGVFIAHIREESQSCPSALMLDSTGDGVQVVFAGMEKGSPYRGLSTRLRQDADGRWLPTSGGEVMNQFKQVQADEVIFEGCTYVNSKSDASRELFSEILSLQ